MVSCPKCKAPEEDPDAREHAVNGWVKVNISITGLLMPDFFGHAFHCHKCGHKWRVPSKMGDDES